MKKFLLIGFLSLCLIPLEVFSQEVNNAQTLRLASATYDQGRLHELEGLLLPKLTPGPGEKFVGAERVTAYRFLILAYIYLEEPEKADATMLNLLRTDPYYTPNADVDPAEYVALFNTFRTRPIYRLGVMFTLNVTGQNVSSYNSISEGKPENQTKLGFGGGFVAEIPMTDRLTLNPELHYMYKKFGSTFTATSAGTATDYSTTTAVESQGWVSLPLMAQYQIKKSSKINPFAVGGFSVDYLLSSSAVIKEQRSLVQSIEPSTTDFKSQRQKINLSVTVGGGIKVRVGGGYLITSLRYVQGLTKINTPSTLLDKQNIYFNTKYTDGIFKINSLYFSVGYVQNFFNPKKKKRN